MSKKLPSVTSDIPRDLRTFIDRLREIITGNGNDRLVSAQDLINGGIAGPGNNGTLVPPTTGKVDTPPAPQNVTATGGVNNIFVEWDNPTYYGHDYTEVYSGGTDVIGDAVLLGFTPGINYVDAIGPEQTRYYWARFVNTVGTKGPFNSVSGTLGETGVEVTHLLDVLNGAITETQLYNTLGARINLIDASASTTNSVAWRVAQEATARTAAIAAEATSRTNAINSEASTRAQAILDEAAARTSGDSSLQTQINLLSAASSGDLGDLLAAVQEEQTARIAGDAAEATARTTLATQLRGSYTGTDSSALTTGIIYNERQTRITAEGVISSSVSSLSSTVSNNYTTLNSAITSEATTRASADSTLSSQLTTLTSTVNTNTAAITSEATTRASADSALSGQISSLTSTVADNTAAISTETTTRANADAALTSSITALTSTVNTNTAAIQTEATTRANADTALSSQITTLTSSVAANGAAITSEATTRADADTALSSSITTLQSTAGANTTAIQTEASTRASETGSLFAKYTVKIDSNGYVSGFGLASTANNATPFSDFIIRADRFAISNPSGPSASAPVTPFIVVTTPTVIEGQTIPVGVYIDGGYIKGGSINGSKIIGGTIENSKLINVSANKITGAALEATSYIESAAYIAGSQGWKIHANGTAEFAAASIRDQLTASQINSNGLSIKDTNGNIILNAGTGAFGGNVTGTINGTAASTVVDTASTALSTANSANSAAATAQSTANSASSTASTAVSTANSASSTATAAQNTANSASSSAATAQSTANSAQSTANSASSTASSALSTANSASSTANTALSTANAAAAAAANKIAADSRSVLSGYGGIAAGTLNWDSAGNRTSGYGVAFTAGGLAAFNSSGAATFVLNASNGNATFGGTLSVGNSPAVSSTSMTGSGAIINPTGTFAMGDSTTNITYNGGALRLNGNVVDIENLIPGAALPNYVRTYKGSTSPTVNVGTLSSNTAWGPLAMDASALNNKLGATDYDAYRTLFPAGTYFYELSVPVKNNTSDTNDATYTALVVNPPGGVGGSYQIIGYDADGYPIYGFVSNPYTVISTAGVNVVGDWQTATIFGVGRFTLGSPTYISPAVMTTEYNNMNVVARSGYCTLIWRVWRAN